MLPCHLHHLLLVAPTRPVTPGDRLPDRRPFTRAGSSSPASPWRPSSSSDRCSPGPPERPRPCSWARRPRSRVLAGTAVTDIPTSSITGDVGLSPAAGTNYAGLTQAEVNGTIYSTNGTGPAGQVDDPALLTTAKNDLTTAYVAAAGQSPDLDVRRRRQPTRR